MLASLAVCCGLLVGQPPRRLSSTWRQRPVCSASEPELLARLAELRRAPSLSARRAVLAAVADLEERSDAVSASAEGRWALLFSMQLAPEKERAGSAALLQPLIDLTYSAFFKVAPALAGSQQDGGRAGGGSNEQTISLSAGRVENRVRVPLPAGLPIQASALQICVNGLVRPEDSRGADRLRVEFEECAFRLLRAGQDDARRELVLPLPRPVGSLRTTFCNERLRISRGGRGGVFVLRRLGVPKAPAQPKGS